MGELKGLGEVDRADRVSYWMASADPTDHDALATEADAEFAIVGGGIVGLTTALLLAEAGREVLVVEADRIAAGVSGYTTAKLTAGHGLLYSHLESSFGTDAARLYAESQLAGLAHVFDLCENHAIDCDLETRPNYVVADTDDQLETSLPRVCRGCSADAKRSGGHVHQHWVADAVGADSTAPRWPAARARRW